MDSIYLDHGKVTFLLGKTNLLLLYFENYLYKRINGNFPDTYWMCIKGCPVIVRTHNGLFESAKNVSLHQHPPMLEEITVIRTNRRILNRVKSDLTLSPWSIYKYVL